MQRFHNYYFDYSAHITMRASAPPATDDTTDNPLQRSRLVSVTRQLSKEESAMRLSLVSNLDEETAWPKYDAEWTPLDRLRLVQLDTLYNRSLEFHNNHHSFRATGGYDYTKDDAPLHPRDIAVEVNIFSFNKCTMSTIAVELGKLEEYFNGAYKVIDPKVIRYFSYIAAF